MIHHAVDVPVAAVAGHTQRRVALRHPDADRFAFFVGLPFFIQRGVYNEFLVTGKLQKYLAQIDRDAQEMFNLLVRQITEQEGVTETLKTENQMEWVQRMNSIHTRATEIVNHELICA